MKVDLYALRQQWRNWNYLIPGGVLHFAQLCPDFNPFAADLALFEECLEDHPEPDWGIRDVFAHGKTFPVTEEVVVDFPFCRLIHFKGEGRKGLPKVFIVAPLSGHYATLLRETVQSFLSDHEVFITDWKNSQQVPLSVGAFSLHDYVNYLKFFFQNIARKGKFHVVAVCQPAVPTIVAVALLAQEGSGISKKITSMTLIGGPVDARCNPTRVNELALTHSVEWFEERLIHSVPSEYSGGGRQVYPGFMSLTNFVNVDRSLHTKAYRDHMPSMFHPALEDTEKFKKFYAEFNAVMDLPGEYYLQTVENVFRQFLLARGCWRTEEGVLVDPKAITTTALFTIEGAKDRIAWVGQTEAAHKLVSSIPNRMRARYLAPGGHYSVFSGSHFREEIYPKIRDFIVFREKK